MMQWVSLRDDRYITVPHYRSNLGLCRVRKGYNRYTGYLLYFLRIYFVCILNLFRGTIMDTLWRLFI